jgi:hypothetical protein
VATARADGQHTASGGVLPLVVLLTCSFCSSDFWRFLGGGFAVLPIVTGGQEEDSHCVRSIDQAVTATASVQAVGLLAGSDQAAVMQMCTTTKRTAPKECGWGSNCLNCRVLSGYLNLSL